MVTKSTEQGNAAECLLAVSLHSSLELQRY
jgi:hypothetical protein